MKNIILINKREYNSNETIGHLLLRLNSIIECEAKDNLQTHLQHVLLFKNEGKALGVVEDCKFKVWIHEGGRRGSTGIFYPVVHGYIYSSNDGTRVSFNSRMNLVGKIIYILFAAFIAYELTTKIIIQDNNYLMPLMNRISISMISLVLAMSVPTFSYLRNSKVIKKYLVSQLNLT